GRAARDHGGACRIPAGRLDQRTFVDRQVVRIGVLPVDGLVDDAHVRARQLLAGDRLLHDRASDVDRDGEADAVRIGGDGRVDADDVGPGVEQRATRIAGVDRGVGLDEVVEVLVAVGRDRPALGRHDATRHRVRIRPERAPDRADQLAPLALGRAAQIGDWHVAGVDLDDREVRQRVDAVDAALEHPAIIELDRQAIAALDDVAVGEDPAVRVVDDAGPGAIAGLPVPQDDVSRASWRWAHRALPGYLLRHSVRSYCWGAAIGAWEGWTVDRRVLWCASLFHDIGLTTIARNTMCFEVEGAELARRTLERFGMDADATDRAAVAIILHMQP